MHLVVVLCGFLFSLYTPTCSAATDTLSRGGSLARDERLVSSNGKFALGFFQTNNNNSTNTTSNSHLGIWFHKVPKLTPVWSANGDNPVSSRASPELMISDDGNLVITAHGTKVWSTQANITANNTVAVLLADGNLVLRSSSNSSDVFWQSFDYPTDTLLPGAKLGRNKVTGLNRRFVSRRNLNDQAPGVYSIGLAPGLDESMRLSWKSSTEYWSSGEWNGRYFNAIPEMSDPAYCNYMFVTSDQEFYFSYTLVNESTIFQVVLDVSGQWKVRVWDWGRNDWVTFSYSPRSQCDVYAVCGAFTICSNNANPLCSCMKGFSVRSPEDWELEDRTGGCIRNTPLDCNDSNKGTSMADKFYPMPFSRLPSNGIGIQSATSAKACEGFCLSSCSCTAYSYGQGGCSVWHDDLTNVAADDSGEIIYLRLAAKEVQSWKDRKHGMNISVSVAVGVSTVTLAFIFLIVIWRSSKRSSHPVDSDQGGIGIIAFRYIDIKRATNNFSEKLGAGGFGSVFKGCLSDSIAIAVKRLDGAHHGEKQFRSEVSSIGIIQHVNLVKLVGFCCEGDRRLLVYEHMPNRSLDVHLFQSHGTVLGWNIRYQIALGVARGLAYLHHSCRDCIIHCDIKPQNILLDASLVPKIADFGMAKFLGRDFSRVLTTMRGTIGYLAPEWISGTAITSKVDVYSYGMVLLEIISGRRNAGKEAFTDDEHAKYFPVQVVDKLLSGGIGSLVDANLGGDVNLDDVERVCKVACWCIQDNEFDRPTMVEVVQFLEGLCEADMPPMPRLLHAIAGGSP
ncbi:G-type lectin S-receptor-like serine/threonine-protein kinase At2g19130 [Miscanthus floridulus]|uniref:G-type lectin S-receptor-like serine/threonine-protein kinase At2g19130 n=1 Tax=Miscanthus floridulus TaxID=154761 RepID=UPI003459327D